MTAQRLYEILKFIDTLDARTGLQKSLEAINEALTGIVSSPANPPFQTALATALTAFEASVASASESITPAQSAAIKEMGGVDFFDASLADTVKTSIQTNAMTPSVAKEAVEKIAVKRAAFMNTVRGARQNMEKLGIRESETKPNSADIAFLIPRPMFDNQLGLLAKELSFISRLMQDFSEATSGQAEQVEVEQLSSSIPTVSILAGVVVIEAVAKVVIKFLEAWEKMEKIRRIREQLTEVGARGEALEEMTERITTTVDETVEESVEIVLANYQGSPERKKELGNAIRQDTHRLFGQIERGLTVEVRAGAPTAKDGGKSGETLANVANLSKVMQFPTVSAEPILLENGEVLEGNIASVRASKKTTTHKTTTTKKETQKESKQD